MRQPTPKTKNERRSHWSHLRKWASNTARLYGRLFADPRVPLWVKAVAGASGLVALLYLVFPGDLDFFFPVGYLDDLLILYLALRLFLKLCPPELVAEHAQALRREQEGGGS